MLFGFAGFDGFFCLKNVGLSNGDFRLCDIPRIAPTQELLCRVWSPETARGSDAWHVLV